CKAAKQLYLDGMKFKLVKCDSVKGWQHRTDKNKQWANIDPSKKHNAEVTIECGCDEHLITGYDKLKIGANEIQCKNPGEKMMIGGIAYGKLKCDANDGWKVADAQPPIKTPIEEFAVACQKPCDKLLIPGVIANKMDYSNNILKCKEESEKLKYKDASGAEKKTSTLECKPDAKWEDNGTPLPFKSTDPLTGISCEVDPCNDKLITKTGSTPLADYNNKELKCSAGKKVQFDTSSTQYDKLTCTDRGWTTDGTTALSPAVTAIATITVKCEFPACASDFIQGLTAAMGYSNNILTCNKPYEKLKFKDASGADKQTSKLECKPDADWEDDGNPSSIKSTDKLTVTSCVIVPCHEGLIDKDGSTPPLIYDDSNKELTCPSGHKVQLDGYSELHVKLKCTD
ncbi:hypothetical protein PMAYCL1PPCAC_03301, partial [Pristionchus mayeri]